MLMQRYIIFLLFKNLLDECPDNRLTKKKQQIVGFF